MYIVEVLVRVYLSSLLLFWTISRKTNKNLAKLFLLAETLRSSNPGFVPFLGKDRLHFVQVVRTEFRETYFHFFELSLSSHLFTDLFFFFFVFFQWKWKSVGNLFLFFHFFPIEILMRFLSSRILFFLFSMPTYFFFYCFAVSYFRNKTSSFSFFTLFPQVSFCFFFFFFFCY
jgi:hypothetical protein